MAQSYQVDIVTKVVGASSVTKLEKSLENLTAEQNKVDAASTRAANGISKFSRASSSASSAAKGASLGVKNLGAAINAAAIKITAIITAVQQFSRVLGVAFERQTAEQRLKNLTSSTEEYEAALLAAAAVSQKFGISQTEANKALGDVYSRLSGVGYGLKEVTTIYEGFNAIARESGVSNEAASAAFLQLGQAMGSGVLQGDELRSILEQMPQLTQAIASEMGIATSQVKQFGADGKITSDVIYAALQKASLGATNLNGKLTPAQQQMNQFSVAVDKASVAIGSTLIPMLTSLLEAITPVIDGVGGLINKLNDLGATKVFNFLMAPARIFGELINGAKENTGNLSEEAEKAVSKFSGLPPKVERAKEATKQLAAAQKEYSAGLAADQGAIDRKLGVAQAILAAERQVNDAKLQQANADMQQATTLAEKEAAIDRIYQITVANAKLEYEATIAAANAEEQKVEASVRHAKVLLEQVKTEVALARAKGAVNDQQQEALNSAQALVNEARKNLEAQNSIKEAIQQGAQATLAKQLEAANVTAEMARQTAQQAQTNDAIEQGAAAMSQLANEAARAASASAGIGGGSIGGGGGGGGGDHTRQWTSKYKPIVTKKLDENGDIVDKTDDEIKREKNAARLQGWKGAFLNVKDGGPDTFAAAAFNASWFAAGLTATDARDQAWRARMYGGMLGPKGSIVGQEYNNMAFAEGGYVTGPQQAIVGEGGEPEYIIPASKMDSAMQRYGSGMRGSSVIPESANVSVNYNGSTVDMGGTSYINKGDVNGIVSQAVNQTLSTLAKSPRARLGAGLR